MNELYVKYVEKKLSRLERAYAAGNFGALYEAVCWCNEDDFPPPKWVMNGVEEELGAYMFGLVVGKPGRHSTWIKKYRQDLTWPSQNQMFQICYVL